MKTLRVIAIAAGLLIGGVGIAYAVDVFYSVFPNLSLDTTTGTTEYYTGIYFQFGTTTGAPVHVGSAQTTAPALTSCGTSPVIAGTDFSGHVTMGTSTPTGCVITFNVAYTGTPVCLVTWEATPLASQSYSVTTTAITTVQTATSSNKIDYICTAPAGG